MRRRYFTPAGEIVIADASLNPPPLMSISKPHSSRSAVIHAWPAAVKLSIGMADLYSYSTAQLGNFKRLVTVAIGGSRKPALNGRWGPTYETF